MRRLGAVLMAFTLAGCGALRDAFSAHAGVAATAAGQDLTVERLAALVSRAKKVEPKVENLSAVASVYVDYMVYAAQLAKGANLEDSMLVLQANWPFVSQLRWEHFHDRLVSARTSLATTQVDSAFQAGTVRLFQHILLEVPASATPKVVEQKRVELERVLRQAKGGASFAALARYYSDDPGSRPGGGYLMASGRGQFVAPFEAAAWALDVGGISDVVRSPFGFHIIRRPPLAEVRDRFGASLAQLVTMHLDSLYMDSLAQRRELKVEDGSPAIVRQIFNDLESARRDSRPLARSKNGTFRVKDLVRWLFAINPEEVRGLSSASDDQLRQFVRVIVQRDMVLSQVDSAGVQLTPDDWKLVRANHDSALSLVNAQLGITPTLLADSAPTPEARLRLAAAHVDGYLGRVMAGETRFVGVPPFLATALRERERWSINAAGVADAVARTKALRASLDSAGGAGGGLRRAPGPPPVGSDTAPKRSAR
jgi:hypothetical protein